MSASKANTLSPLSQGLIFSAIALVLSWVPSFFAGDEDSILTLCLVVIRLTSPLVASLILRKLITREGFAESGPGDRDIRPWVWLLAAALPIAWHGLSLTTGLVFGQITLDMTRLAAGGMLWGLTGALLWVLPEELGWRGTLLPKLMPLGVHPALLATGVIWFAWHPEMVLGDQGWQVKLLFFVDVILFSYAIGWIYLRTRSVWPCVLTHAVNNLLVNPSVVSPIDSTKPFLAELTFTASLALIVAGLWLVGKHSKDAGGDS